MDFLRPVPHALFASAIAAVVFACSSSSTDAVLAAKLAGGCSINSECTQPLVCAFKTCHNACKTTRDCPAGQRCVASDRPYNVCQLPGESTCTNNTQCPLGEVCASDGQCRDECQSQRDCISGQTCTAGACAENSELVNGHLPSVGDAGPAANEGIACVYNTDCPDPLTCRNGRCALECHGDRDCAHGERCVKMACTVNGVVVGPGGGGDGGNGDGGGNLAPGCTNRVKDGNEVDIDCGGTCGPCGTDSKCGIPADCISNLCTNSVCKAQPQGGQINGFLYDSNQPTFANAASLDGMGNLVFSLTTNGTINFGAGPITPQGTELFVIKAPVAGGAPLWSRELAGGRDAVGTFADANGDVIVVGTTSGASVGGMIFSPDCTNSLFVAKYAAATGAHLFSKCIKDVTGGYGARAGGIVPKSAVLDKDGNIEVGGTITMVKPDDGQGFTTFPFVGKFSGVDGSAVWSRYYNDIYSSAVVNGVSVDAANNVIITGAFGYGANGFGGTALMNAGNNDIFVVKLNASGDFVWSRAMGGTLEDHGAAVSVDSANDVIVAANFQSQIDTGKGPLTSAGSYDVLMMKLAGTNGATQWVNRYGGAGEEVARSISIGPGNVIALAGEFTTNVTFGATALTNKGGRDIFAAKFLAAGTLDWVHGYGSTGDDAVVRINVGPNGNMALTGYVAGAVDFGAGSSPACSKAGGGGCKDGFLVILAP